MPRFFVDQQPQDGVLTLTGENAHHAGRVLRLRVGEGVTLCDGAGMDFDCTVETVEKEAVTCRVVSCHAADTEPKRLSRCLWRCPRATKWNLSCRRR
ncbi:MAG: RNA methyltransferase PUA domain-containing protein [Agathobaculum butyriciproducens]